LSKNSGKNIRQPGDYEMAVAKKRAKRKEWTKTDVRELKTLARQRTAARVIGRKLGRTEGAVRQKAYAEGVSFNSRRTKLK
jgi:hypothetical protein